MFRPRAHVISVAAMAACTIPSGAFGTQKDVASLVDRITWGCNQESVAEAEYLGASRWLEQQLRPSGQPPLPPAVQAQIDAMRISTTPMAGLVVELNAQSRTAGSLRDPLERQAAQQAYQRTMTTLKQQATARSLFRDLYSENQLQEQMTWFWFNHFNVQADKRDIRAMVPDYEDQAIRPHALGKFRDLLRATELHPAMLRYLENDQNAIGHVNENFAREILELHTLGVASGYTQRDVEEMARVLTGVGISLLPHPPKLSPEQQSLYVRRGLMEFDPSRHDFGKKAILGKPVEGTGLSEFENTLDLLARHPATARHISTELALYFVGSASSKLIDRMTAKFLHSDGDIAAVLETLFRSAEFKNSLGKKLKDPTHYVISAMRLAYSQPITNTAPLQTWIDQLGESLYGRDTPDGYPLETAAWSGAGQLIATFEVARHIGSSSAGLFKLDGGIEEPTVPQIRNAPFCLKTQAPLSEQTKTALAQARSLAEWNILFLSSPEFLHR